MSANATMTMSTSPVPTSRSSAVNDNIAAFGSVTALSSLAMTVVNQALPGTGAQNDLGGQLRRRLLHAAPPQVHHPVFGVDVALAGLGHRPRGRRADQHGGTDLDGRAVSVGDGAFVIGGPRMAAIDYDQSDETAQPGCRQFPRE